MKNNNLINLRLFINRRLIEVHMIKINNNLQILKILLNHKYHINTQIFLERTHNSPHYKWIIEIQIEQNQFKNLVLRKTHL